MNCDKPLLDYEQALQLARKENKPVLIDFTGWACVNCRRMEEKVWTKPDVEKLMRNDFIVVSLYVDERTKLPTAQQTVYKAKNGSEKSIITVGDKWTTFQIDNFNATSQPQYAIISPDEKALAKTKFYTPDAHEFAAWLQCGLDAFKKSQTNRFRNIADKKYPEKFSGHFNLVSFCSSLHSASNMEKFFFEVRTFPVGVGDTE